MVVANVPVPVTANTNIKVLVDLKLTQDTCRHSDIFLHISDVLNDFFHVYN